MWGGTFSLEMAYFSVNSVVYFNRNVRLFSARTTTVTVYCWWLMGPLTGEGSGDGAVTPPQKILGLFHLKWLVLVQIPLYILTEMLGNLLLGPQQLHVYMYC